MLPVLLVQVSAPRFPNLIPFRSFQSELQQLRDMGIEDEALSLRALQATNGNVQAACDLIFEGGLD